MKRKLLIAGLVVAGMFVVLIVAVGLMQSSRGAAEAYSQVTVTADGQLVVEPPARQQTVIITTRNNVTNADAFEKLAR